MAYQYAIFHIFRHDTDQSTNFLASFKQMLRSHLSDSTYSTFTIYVPADCRR